MIKNFYSKIAAKEPTARTCFFWNLMGSCVNAFASVFLLMIVNRISGSEEGGVFAIGYAVAQLMWAIGSFETMTYQVTDTKNEFKFSEYFGFKICICGVMVISCILDIIIQGFDPYKMIVTLLLCLFRVFDAFSTLYFGTLQKVGRLNLAGFSYFSRMILSYGAMVAVLIITKNLVASILVSCVIEMLWILLFEIPITANFEKMRPSFIPKKIKGIFFSCLPLFASVFILMYLNNSPKYAVDSVLGETAVNTFSILFMPAFVITLLASFIFRPMLNSLSEVWNNEKNVKKFVKMTFMILSFILLSTAVVMIVGYFLGIPVLSWFYGIELGAYRNDLMIILLAGGFAAFGSGLYNVITVMRKQRLLLFGYIVAAILSLTIAKPLVSNFEITGAALTFLATMAFSSLLFFVAFLVFVRNKNKKIKEISNE